MAFTQQSSDTSAAFGTGDYYYGNTGGANNDGRSYPFASPPPPAPPPAPGGDVGRAPGASPAFFESRGAYGNSAPANPNNSNSSSGASPAAADMMWRMGLNYGQSIVQQGLEQGEQGVRKYVPYWSNLRGFFAVDNQYVKRKLGILLFPFTRRFGGAPGGSGNTSAALYGRSDDQVFGSPTGAAISGFSGASGASGAATARAPMVLPTQDAFAPDLYIPLMAVITYLLICALLHGVTTGSPVTTAFLASVLFRVSMWCAFEVILGKVFSYFLRAAPGLSVLHLIALSGYKYVWLCIVLLLHSLLGLGERSFAFTGALFAYAVAAHAVFVIKSVGRENAKEDGRVPPRARLLAYAATASQVLCILWTGVRLASYKSRMTSSFAAPTSAQGGI